MKKIMTIIAIATIIAATGCKKSDSGTSPATTNSWKLGATSYTTVFATRINTNSGAGNVTALTAFDSMPSGSNANSNTCILYFATAPTSGGTYRVVAYPSTSALTATQVGLGAAAGSTTYYSTGAGTVDVVVTVSGGKITATIPEAPVKKANGTEELKLSGTITEL